MKKNGDFGVVVFRVYDNGIKDYLDEKAWILPLNVPDKNRSISSMNKEENTIELSL